LGNGEDLSLVGSSKFSIFTHPTKRNEEQMKKIRTLFPEI